MGGWAMLALALIPAFMFILDHVREFSFKQENSKSLTTLALVFCLLAGLYICLHNAFPAFHLKQEPLPKQFTWNLPYVNFKIEKLDLDSVSAKLTLKLRFVNTSDNHHALDFYRATTVLCDSVPESDSSWAVNVLMRHKNEGITLKPREMIIIPVTIGEMQSTIKIRKAGSAIGGVREFFKNIDFYIIGGYSYHDEANNRYLCTYCISYDPWTDSQHSYPKYNSNIPVNW